MLRMFWIAAGLVALASLCGQAQAQIGNASHTDKPHKFTAKAPQRWYRTPELISDANEFFSLVNPWRTCTVTQVWQRSSTPELTYPYIVLEVSEVDLSILSFADIEKAFDARTRNEMATTLGKPAAQMVGSLTDGEIVLDRQRKRLVQKINEKDEEGVAYADLTVGFLGKGCVAFLTITCDDKKLETYLPEFQEFVDGFKWDSGGEYTAPGQGAGTTWTANRSKAQIAQREAEAGKSNRRSSNSSGSTSSFRFGRRGFGIGGIGLVVAAVLGLLVRWMLKE